VRHRGHGPLGVRPPARGTPGRLRRPRRLRADGHLHPGTAVPARRLPGLRGDPAAHRRGRRRHHPCRQHRPPRPAAGEDPHRRRPRGGARGDAQRPPGRLPAERGRSRPGGRPRRGPGRARRRGVPAPGARADAAALRSLAGPRRGREGGRPAGRDGRRGRRRSTSSAGVPAVRAPPHGTVPVGVRPAARTDGTTSGPRHRRRLLPRGRPPAEPARGGRRRPARRLPRRCAQAVRRRAARPGGEHAPVRRRRVRLGVDARRPGAHHQRAGDAGRGVPGPPTRGPARPDRSRPARLLLPRPRQREVPVPPGAPGRLLRAVRRGDVLRPLRGRLERPPGRHGLGARVAHQLRDRRPAGPRGGRHPRSSAQGRGEPLLAGLAGARAPGSAPGPVALRRAPARRRPVVPAREPVPHGGAGQRRAGSGAV
ncbi:MAG: hypothetical protein AVDCRST_MAG06-1316, partial [uncultured Nocardioides sp.]